MLAKRSTLRSRRRLTRLGGAGAIVACLLAPAATRAEWMPPVRLASAGDNAHVAVDGRGDAFAAWQECRAECHEQVVMSDYLSAGSIAWQPPVEVSGGGEGFLAQIAADSLGDGLAVWSTHAGPQSASRRASVGSWQAPAPIAPAAEAYDPRIAVDPGGDAVAVWRSKAFGIEASLRPASTGVWEAPASISSPGEHASEPSVAIREGGEVAVAWSAYEPETVPCAQPSSTPCVLIVKNRESLAAAIRPARGSWAAPDRLAQAEAIGEPTVALDGAGNATAVWTAREGAARTIESARHPAGGTWQERVTISAGQLPNVVNALDSDVQLGVDSQGEVTAAWTHEATNAKHELSGARAVETAVRHADGSWSAPSTISGEERYPGGVRLAENASGAAVAVWACSSVAGRYPLTARGAIRPAAAASWQRPVDISPIEGGFPDVALGPEGRAVSIWNEDGPFTTPAPPPGVYVSVYEPALTGPGVPQSQACASSTAPVRSVPVLSRFRITHRRFRVSRAPTAIEAKAATGATFAFVLSAPARVELALSRYVPGLTRGRRCVAPSAALRRAHARRCRRGVAVGKLVRRSEPAGEDRVPFSGRLGRRPLAPGDYVARATAVDAAGSSRPVEVRFAIVR